MSLVTSPNYAQSGCFDKTLIKFLTQRRLLKVGDVVAIDVYGELRDSRTIVYVFVLWLVSFIIKSTRNIKCTK